MKETATLENSGFVDTAWGCGGPRNDIQKTLVNNSADIQYAKWQHTAGIEKYLQIMHGDLIQREKIEFLIIFTASLYKLVTGLWGEMWFNEMG